MIILQDLRSQVTVACLHFAVLFMVTARKIKDNTPLPKFLPTKTNLTFNRGEVAEIVCSIEDLGARSVVWRRASEPHPLSIGVMRYVNDNRLSVRHAKDHQTWHLYIENVQPRDAGVYECQISSKNSLIKLFMLRVNDVPSTASNIQPSVHVRGTEVVEVGQPIKLECNTTKTAKTAQDLDWFRSGDKMRPNFNKKVTIKTSSIPGTNIYTSRLVIEHSQKSDAGKYLCRNADQQVARIDVDVLNTKSSNVKRGGSTMEESTWDTSGAGRHKRDSFLHLLLTVVIFVALLGNYNIEHS